MGKKIVNTLLINIFDQEGIKKFGTDLGKNLDFINIRKTHIQAVVENFVIHQNKCVHIYERNETLGQWNIKKENGKITPSNLSIDSICDTAFNLCCIIIEIKKNIRTLGIGLINHSLYRLEITQYVEDCHYTKIQSLFAAKGVKQCFYKCSKSNKLNSNIEEINKFKDVLRKCDVKLIDVTNNKFWSFINNEQTQISTINNIINKESKTRLLNFNNNNNKLSLIALTAIISHQELQKDDKNFNHIF